MKLTEAKLKQMILDEIQSNLSPDDTAQLQADIEMVRELSADVDGLRDERYRLTPAGQTRQIGRHRTPELVDIDHRIAKLSQQIRSISQKYNIRHYYDSPGNYDLINLMKKKFRRKSLSESKSREDHINGAT